MNEYTLSYRFLNGNVHGCVFAKNRPVSLNWSDYTETISSDKRQKLFRTHLITLFCQEKVGTTIGHKNFLKLCSSESIKGRKTGPRHLYPFPDARMMRIKSSQKTGPRQLYPYPDARMMRIKSSQKTGPRQLYPFPDARMMRIKISRICL